MEVICIRTKPWGVLAYGPKYGELVHPTGESIVHKDSWYLAEYPLDKRGNPCSYTKRNFVSLDKLNITELTEILEQEPSEA